MTEVACTDQRSPVPGERAVEVAVGGARRRWLLAGCSLGLCALVPYANALGAGFAFDDWIQIWGHPALHNPIDWSAVLAAPLFPGDLYRPLTLASFALDFALVGRQAWWFHLGNLVLHATVTWLVALTAWRLFRCERVAWLAGALFAVHPIHTEAVTGVVGRAELLVAFFGFLALLAAGEAVQCRSLRADRGWMAVSLASFFCALFAKENALVWLPLIFLYRIALAGQAWAPGLRKEARSLIWVPYAACVAVYLFFRSLVVGSILPSAVADFGDNVLAHVSAAQRVTTALAILADSVSQFLLPLVLSADYSYPQVVPLSSLWELRLWLGTALVSASIGAFFLCRGPLGYAAAFPLVSLALTANLFFAIGTVRAERLWYLPSAGLCWLIALGLSVVLGEPRRRLVAGFIVLLLLAYAVRTGVRNQDWRDQLTLFAATARDAPRSSKAHFNHAIELQRAGSHADALAAYRRAWELYPRDQRIAFGLATAYEDVFHFEDALQWYDRTIRIDPGHRGAHRNRCRLLIGLARWQEAERACRLGLRVASDDANLWKGLGLAWQQLGRPHEARGAFTVAAQLDPTDSALRALVESRPEGPPREEVQP